MPLPILKPIATIQLEPGSIMTIPDVSGEEFEGILMELGERRSSRIAYSNNTLQIMVPLPEHELPNDLISDFVKLLLKKFGRRYQAFGSTTFRKGKSAGVEPDSCFYIANYQQMIGRRRLEPTDPPPDLAIETDVASKTTLDAYIAIAVPELWVYDNGKLTINLLVNGQYQPSEISSTFPGVDVAKIIPALVERSWEVGSVQALEEFEVGSNNLWQPE